MGFLVDYNDVAWASQITGNSTVCLTSCSGWQQWKYQSSASVSLYDVLQWRHNWCDSVSKHQPHDCFLSRLFRHRSKKTSKAPRHWPCAGNSPEAGEFPAQMASNAENVSIWRRHQWMTVTYRQTSNISLALVGYKMVDHSDVVKASPVDAVPTNVTSSFPT